MSGKKGKGATKLNIIKKNGGFYPRMRMAGNLVGNKRDRVHIRSSFCGTLITATDTQGNAIAWASSDRDNPRNDTQFAAQKVAYAAIERGIKTVEIIVKGP